MDQGRLAEAERLQRETLPIARSVLGSDFPLTGWTSIDLARVLVRRGKHDEALSVLQDALDQGGLTSHAGQIEPEPDFMPLHADPRFEALVAELKKRSGTSP